MALEFLEKGSKLPSLPCMAHNGSSFGRVRGLTAIEVLISLLIIATLIGFVAPVFEFARRTTLETDQYDAVAQISSDILRDLKAGADWRQVREIWESEVITRHGTDFSVQVLPDESSVSGVTEIELTIIWNGLLGGSYQEVFTTHVFDSGGPFDAQ